MVFYKARIPAASFVTMESTYTMKNFNGKPDIVGCLLVKNGLWPADFSTMYSNFEHFIPVISVHYREVSGPESVFNQ